MNAPLRHLLALGCAFCLAPSAGAHAFLEHAEPKVGSTVHGTPSEVKLWFTERLEPAFSTAQVRDASGGRVGKAPARIDPAHPELLQVAVPPLAPGTYHVTWRVLSLDTHVTEGDFTFVVAP